MPLASSARLVSADGQLVPGNNTDPLPIWEIVFGHLAAETSLALTVIVYKPVYVLCGILILVLLSS